MNTRLNQYGVGCPGQQTSDNWPDLSSFAVEDIRQLPPLYENSHLSSWYNTYYDEDLHCTVVEPHPRGVEEPKFRLPSDFVAILADPTRFLQEHGIAEITIPLTYTGIKSWTPRLTTMTAASSGLGYGLTRFDLKGLLRLTNGKGRISDDTRIFHCHGDQFLAVGPCGAFVLKQSPVHTRNLPDRWTEDEYRPYINESDLPRINNTPIPEENPAGQRGFEIFRSLFEKYGTAPLNNYKYFDGRHIFEDVNGDTVYGQYFTRLDAMEKNPDGIVGQYSHELDGKQYSIHLTSEDIKYGIGDAIDTPLGSNKYVIGYNTEWNRKPHVYSNSLYSLQFIVRYTYFQEQEKYDYHDYEIRTEDDVLRAFEL
jgi:hypothetical protein